jgi:hypothetical protein
MNINFSYCNFVDLIGMIAFNNFQPCSVHTRWTSMLTTACRIKKEKEKLRTGKQAEAPIDISSKEVSAREEDAEDDARQVEEVDAGQLAAEEDAVQVAEADAVQVAEEDAGQVPEEDAEQDAAEGAVEPASNQQNEQEDDPYVPVPLASSAQAKAGRPYVLVQKLDEYTKPKPPRPPPPAYTKPKPVRESSPRMQPGRLTSPIATSTQVQVLRPLATSTQVQVPRPLATSTQANRNRSISSSPEEAQLVLDEEAVQSRDDVDINMS